MSPLLFEVQCFCTKRCFYIKCGFSFFTILPLLCRPTFLQKGRKSCHSLQNLAKNTLDGVSHFVYAKRQFVKKALDSKHHQKERLHLCIIIVLHFNTFILQSYNDKGPLNTKCSVIINIFSLVIGTPSWCTKTTTKKKRVMHGS